MQTVTHKLTLSAMFLALGVLFPIMFHAVGLGSIFLPMFWPIALAGFFLGAPVAALIGAFTPVVSFLLTGMPPPPVLVSMVPELAVLAAVIEFFHSRLKWGTVLSLLAALMISMCVSLLVKGLLAPLIGLPSKPVVIASLIHGVPGMICMLVLIPLLLRRIPAVKLKKEKNDA
jgi:hypothetical protein